MLVIGRPVPIVADRDDEDFVVTYGQVIPKPFCASGPASFLFAEGPVRFRQHAGINEAGVYHVQFGPRGA